MRSVWCLTAVLVVNVLQTPASPLRPQYTIPLPNVQGRIDHLAADIQRQRLFVAALGNNTVEALDLSRKRLIKSLAGLDEPQGIRYLPDANRIVVANGGNGSVALFDAERLDVAGSVKLSGDADNVRYDAAAHRVYVGYGGGSLAVLGPDGSRLGDIRLGGHPESFQLAANDRRIFVNVPDAGHIALVDRDRQAVTASWPVKTAAANYPMALDEAHHRLFVGCRRPAKLLVYDTDGGALVASVEIVGDTDDLFYDSATRRLYVIGGEGAVTVVDQQDADRYRVTARVPTAAGARTGLFVPEWHQLFVAVPHRGSQGAEVRVFDTQ
jgi:DNA-binding beta-propeller fold protein YncE